MQNDLRYLRAIYTPVGERGKASQPSFVVRIQQSDGIRLQRTKPEAPLETKGGLKEVLDISAAPCDRAIHTYMHTHTGEKHIYVHTKTTSQTALHPLLLTPTPSESSHHPPLHSPIVTALHFPFSRHAHGSKAVFLALLDRNTKPLLMHPEEAPLERPPSRPG